MRLFAITALVGTLTLITADWTLAQVTLDARALKVLETTNPEYFRRANEIMRVASEQGCASAATVAKTRFGATDAQCDSPAVVRTSDPPRARLMFSLGGTAYIYFLPMGKGRTQERKLLEEGLQPKSPAKTVPPNPALNRTRRCRTTFSARRGRRAG